MTLPCETRIRLAVRGLLLLDDRLLLVNAWPEKSGSDLLCAPGGGAELHASLPQNLIREFHEETGLTIGVDAPCLINEFHDPEGGFHQVEVFFHVHHRAGALSPDWRDPEGVVTRTHLLSRAEMATAHFRPKSLADVAWGPPEPSLAYDPLERILR